MAHRYSAIVASFSSTWTEKNIFAPFLASVAPARLAGFLNVVSDDGMGMRTWPVENVVANRMATERPYGSLRQWWILEPGEDVP